MKKFLLGTVGLVALSLSAPASAADLAARPYTKAPPPMIVAIYDWSGFYVGPTAVGDRATSAGISSRWLEPCCSLKVATMRPVARSVAKLAIAGRHPTGCSAWKHRATGLTLRASA